MEYKMMSVERCLEFLGWRIDAIYQLLYNLNVPVLNGVMGTSGGLVVNRHRLSSYALPSNELKQAERKWKVGIYDDTVSSGVSVFEGDTLIDALNDAVKYVKVQEG